MRARLTPRAMTASSLAFKVRTSVQRRSAAARAIEARRAAFYEKAWSDAAASVGAGVIRLGHGVLDIDVGGQLLRVCGNTTSLDDPVTLRVAGDKPLVHRLLAERDVPVPRHVVCGANDLTAAFAFLADARCPVAVKPARSTGAGRGVSAGVTERVDLVRAMAIAGAFCEDVVIEGLVNGDNYRLLYLDGELLDAVLRVPPWVEGDGTSSLGHLIREENRARLRGGILVSQSLLAVDGDLKRTLRAQGCSLRSVPAAGRRIRLKCSVSDNRRADNQTATAALSDAVVESGAVAVRAVGSRLAGVDIITPDASLPLSAAGGVVLEVNTTPGLYYHVTESGDVPAARAILERLRDGGAQPSRGEAR